MEFSEADAYCKTTYGGTNIIVDSQEITDWVASYNLGEHWIGALINIGITPGDW